MILYERKGTHVIVYTPFWETLKRKNISIYKLIHTYEFSRGLIDNLRHNRPITMRTLNDIMLKLDVKDISEIVEFIPDDEKTHEDEDYSM